MYPEEYKARIEAIKAYLENCNIANVEQVAKEIFDVQEKAWNFHTDYTFKKNKFNEDLKSESGRRYHICSLLTYDIDSLIEALPVERMHKDNLYNLKETFKNMYLALNDGNVRVKRI